MNPQLILRESDVRCLHRLLGAPERRKGLDAASLTWLEGELARAQIVADDLCPEDVVTLNSIVELEDLTDGEVETYALVLPGEADPGRNRVSVLAPLGMGMLGYRVGDEFEWPIPTGTARFKVRRLAGTVAETGALAMSGMRGR